MGWFSVNEILWRKVLDSLKAAISKPVLFFGGILMDFWGMTLTDAMRLIVDAEANGLPVPFDIRVMTCNREKKTGGEFLEMKGVVKTGLPFNCSDKFMFGIKVPESGAKPIAVHGRLITKINEQTITY